MTNIFKQALFWTPRTLSIIFIAFLSLFALDVFGGPYGFWQTLLALFIHLIPSFVLIAALVLAWRWEWIGAALYAAAGLLYIKLVLPRPSLPIEVRLFRCSVIAGPALVIAALFLIGWLKRAGLRTKA